MGDMGVKIGGKAVLAKTYENAVKLLDVHTAAAQEKSDPETFLQADLLRKCLGLNHHRLDKLSIIHVSGSKGKGSVCAMCECILRQSGLKTGFLSSPHLVEFRERIRINGKPLAKKEFAKYFFDLFDRLDTDDDDDDGDDEDVRAEPNGTCKEAVINGDRSYIQGGINGQSDTGMVVGNGSTPDSDQNYTQEGINGQSDTGMMVGNGSTPDSDQNYTQEGVNGQSYTGVVVGNGSTPDSDDVREYGEYKVHPDVSTFHFLTMMAYHVFIEEKVDVAVTEVGLGGILDSTNVHRCPTVVGISLLDFDHMNILGNTLEEIARAKAGICKPGRPAFTVGQPDYGLEALSNGADEFGASRLLLCPPLSSYDFKGHPIEIGLSGRHQHINASLALQLCKTWMEEMGKGKFKQGISEQKLVDKKNESNVVTTVVPMAEPFTLPDSFIKGLRAVYWPGRSQTIRRNNISYYIDGAHSPQSIIACLEWFNEKAMEEEKSIDGCTMKVLVFNIRGDRDYPTLIKSFMPYFFHEAIFCPSVLKQNGLKVPSADSWAYLTNNYSDQFMKCKALATCYTSMSAEHVEVKGHAKVQPGPQALVLPCVQSAMDHVAELGHAYDHVQVLVTGSLYLVGAVLALLEPTLAFDLERKI